MKLVLFVVVAVVIGALIRDFNIKQNARTRAHAEAMAAELKAQNEKPAPSTSAATNPVPSNGDRTATYVPGLRRYVEHDSNTPAMRSIGGGGGGNSAPARPSVQPVGTMLDRPAQR